MFKILGAQNQMPLCEADQRRPHGKRHADLYPLGCVSEAVVHTLPKKIGDIIAGKARSTKIEQFVAKLLKEKSLVERIGGYCEGNEPARAKIALLDLVVLDAALFHCQARENQLLTEIITKLSQALGRPGMLTYELITIINPPEATRGFLPGKEGSVEREFYLRHGQIEVHLADTLTHLRAAREKLLRSPIAEAEVSESLLAARDQYREVLNHMQDFFGPLNAKAFESFRRFNAGVRGAPGPSGLYSANTYAVQLAVFGDTIASRVAAMLEKKALLPPDCVETVESEFKASAEGLSMLRLSQRAGISSAIRDLVAELMQDHIAVSYSHRRAFSRLVPPSDTPEQRGTGGVYNPHKYIYGGLTMLEKGYQEFLWAREDHQLMRGPIAQVEIADNYSVSRVIRGAWQLAGGHGVVDRESALGDLEGYARAGITFDCADIYTGVEELIGEVNRRLSSALKAKVHTKFVPNLDMLADISREYIEKSIRGSLSRLSVDALDLVQFHWWDFSIPGHVEAALELRRLKELGLIRNIGVTNYDSEHLRELLEAGVPIVSNQVQYSLLDSRPERSLGAFAKLHDIKLLCYGTVAGGFITEKYLGAVEPDSPLENRSLVKYKLMIDEIGGWEPFQELLKAVHEVAIKHSVSMASVASRYVLERSAVAAVIVGGRQASQLQKNQEILEFALDEEDYAKLNRVLEIFIPVPGEVYELERQRTGKHGAIMRYKLQVP